MFASIDASTALQQRALRGAVLLAGRSMAVKVLTVGCGVVLARILTPTDFGLYAIVAFVVSFFTAFSDVGLGAALIQQREAPTRDDLTTTFTLQLSLVSCVIVIGLIASSAIGDFYHMSSGRVWLLRVLLLSLPIGLLRSIPAILLERDLSYGRLSIVEASEDLSFQAAAVVLALLHFGVWSFVWAAITRAALGVMVAMVVSPWRPGTGFSRASAERLLRFGVPYQLQGTLSFIKDSMTPTLIAALVGAAAVGYINWAFALAFLPLTATRPLTRVLFPAMARAQTELHLMKRMIERSVRLSSIVFLPVSVLILAAGPQITHLIYTDKWAPALPAFYLFSISLWTGPLLGSAFFSAFYATGRSKLALHFTIMYGVLDWVIGVPLVLLFGFNGIAIRAVIVAYGTLPILLLAMRRVIPVNTVQQVIRPAAASAVAGVVELSLLRALPAGLVWLAVSGALAAGVYGVMIAFWERPLLSLTLTRLLPAQTYPFIRWYAVVPQAAGE
jgi:O-antigen/teichoic acid export membrane protein